MLYHSHYYRKIHRHVDKGATQISMDQQAPNPDPKVRQSLKKPKNPILWTGADSIITWFAFLY